MSELVPSARNARTHTPAQVRQIADAIVQWGWTNPILMDEHRELIAGHGRVMAAHLLGLHDVPAMTATGWTDEQKRAFRIADNKLPENARWDFALLRGELSELSELKFDLSTIGFSADDLAAFLMADAAGARVGDASGEWNGMPEFDQHDTMPFRTIKMHFLNQAAVDAFAALIGQTISDKTIYLWHPRSVKAVLADKQYAVSDA